MSAKGPTPILTWQLHLRILHTEFHGSHTESIFLPRIEYCSPLWAPYKRKDIEKLEGIQRTFTVKIEEMSKLNYHQRLKELKMYSMQRRFERFIILNVWKILEGFTVNVNNEIQCTINKRTGRKCIVKLPGKHGGIATQTKYYNSFTIRGPRLFNALPIEIRNISSVTSLQFKRKLDEYLQYVPDRPLINGYPNTGDNSLLCQKRLSARIAPLRSTSSPAILHNVRQDEE